MRALAMVLVCTAALLAAPRAHAAGAKGGKAARHKLVCTGKGKARRCKRVGVTGGVTNHRVTQDELRAAPLERPSGWVAVVGADGQTLRLNIYNDDGSYNQDALAQLDQVWQCKKTHEVHAVDPRLYEVLSMLYDHYGEPIVLLSGFRFQQNEGSRHFHASAMDVRVPGVSYEELFTYAQTLDPGGMGIGKYPYMDFVHIDFRAPGEGSVRWTDTARHVNGSDPGKAPSRAWVRKPNS
jgi:uncharacterized protein YcbK (DUF882 family)